ncbi:MAG: rhodanese-like domain-containing protein, partial [Crocinitomicaceae bacterium]|nr:rhodanese-like domain-containing protein [Crocinitomicaceae bacterium]
DFIPSIGAEELFQLTQVNEINLIDARKPSEFEAEHASIAVNKPLDFIHNELSTLDKNERYYVHCRSGYRSLIYTSLLKAAGIKDVIDIDGGYVAMQETAIPVTDFSCQSES